MQQTETGGWDGYRRLMVQPRIILMRRLAQREHAMLTKGHYKNDFTGKPRFDTYYEWDWFLWFSV